MANSVEEFGSKMKRWGKNILIGGLLIWAGFEIGSEMIEQVYAENPDLMEAFTDNIETTRTGVEGIVPLDQFDASEITNADALSRDTSSLVDQTVANDLNYALAA